MEKKFLTSKNVATLAILSALIVIIQLISGFIKIGPVNLNFVLIPIVMGAIVIGLLGGAILGLVFGLVCFVLGLLGVDGFTYILISEHPIITFLTCTVKGVSAGLASALVFKVLQKKNEYLSVVLAALVAPIVNTGLFIVGALIMSDAIGIIITANSLTVDIMYFLIIMVAGSNFLVEFALNCILAPSLYRVVKYLRTRR